MYGKSKRNPSSFLTCGFSLFPPIKKNNVSGSGESRRDS